MDSYEFATNSPKGKIVEIIMIFSALFHRTEKNKNSFKTPTQAINNSLENKKMFSKKLFKKNIYIFSYKLGLFGVGCSKINK